MPFPAVVPFDIAGNGTVPFSKSYSPVTGHTIQCEAYVQ